jgi:hypothetical protein
MPSIALPSLIRAELPAQAWRVIYLRYLCAAALVLAPIILTQRMRAVLNPFPLYGLAAALVAINILYSYHLLRLAYRTGTVSPEAAARSLGLQAAADLFLLTLVLHFSGGVNNPLMAMYVAPILLSAFLLSIRSTYALVAIAMICYAGMVILEYRGVIPHIPVPGLFPSTEYRNEAYLLVVLTAFTGTILFTAVLGAMVSGRLENPGDLGNPEKSIIKEEPSR